METASGAVSHPRPALAIEPVPTAKGEVAGFVLWIASYVSFGMVPSLGVGGGH